MKKLKRGNGSGATALREAAAALNSLIRKHKKSHGFESMCQNCESITFIGGMPLAIAGELHFALKRAAEYGILISS